MDKSDLVKFRSECISTHNFYRSLHGTTPLVWSTRLADGAQKWAEQLASADSLTYSQERGIGENIACLWGSNVTGNKVTQIWYEESQNYDYSAPRVTPNNRPFCQVVWEGTRELGAGKASTKNGKQVVVARYHPPASRKQVEKNVKSPKIDGSTALATRTSVGLRKFQEECLFAHNEFRVLHGAPPLHWSPSLAWAAQQWAEELAEIGELKHNNDEMVGENLAGMVGDELTGKECTDMWYEEVNEFDFENPCYSEETSNFTQVVWIGSELFGVGRAKIADTCIVVAFYEPPGNIEGLFGANVRLQGTKVKTYRLTKEMKTFIPPSPDLEWFRIECLVAHNYFRARHGAPPLVIGQALNEEAQYWAERLLVTGATEDLQDSRIGINVAVIHGHHVSGLKVTELWYDEGTGYNFESPGFSLSTRSFTQLVWLTSRKLGIGKATNNSGQCVIVARYEPVGNIDGLFVANVRRRGDERNGLEPMIFESDVKYRFKVEGRRSFRMSWEIEGTQTLQAVDKTRDKTRRKEQAQPAYLSSPETFTRLVWIESPVLPRKQMRESCDLDMEKSDDDKESGVEEGEEFEQEEPSLIVVQPIAEATETVKQCERAIVYTEPQRTDRYPDVRRSLSLDSEGTEPEPEEGRVLSRVAYFEHIEKIEKDKLDRPKRSSIELTEQLRHEQFQDEEAKSHKLSEHEEAVCQLEYDDVFPKHDENDERDDDFASEGEAEDDDDDVMSLETVSEAEEDLLEELDEYEMDHHIKSYCYEVNYPREEDEININTDETTDERGQIADIIETELDKMDKEQDSLDPDHFVASSADRDDRAKDEMRVVDNHIEFVPIQVVKRRKDFNPDDVIFDETEEEKELFKYEIKTPEKEKPSMPLCKESVSSQTRDRVECELNFDEMFSRLDKTEKPKGKPPPTLPKPKRKLKEESPTELRTDIVRTLETKQIVESVHRVETEPEPVTVQKEEIVETSKHVTEEKPAEPKLVDAPSESRTEMIRTLETTETFESVHRVETEPEPTVQKEEIVETSKHVTEEKPAEPKPWDAPSQSRAEMIRTLETKQIVESVHRVEKEPEPTVQKEEIVETSKHVTEEKPAEPKPWDAPSQSRAEMIRTLETKQIVESVHRVEKEPEPTVQKEEIVETSKHVTEEKPAEPKPWDAPSQSRAEMIRTLETKQIVESVHRVETKPEPTVQKEEIVETSKHVIEEKPAEPKLLEAESKEKLEEALGSDEETFESFDVSFIDRERKLKNIFKRLGRRIELIPTTETVNTPREFDRNIDLSETKDEEELFRVYDAPIVDRTRNKNPVKEEIILAEYRKRDVESEIDLEELFERLEKGEETPPKEPVLELTKDLAVLESERAEEEPQEEKAKAVRFDKTVIFQEHESVYKDFVELREEGAASEEYEDVEEESALDFEDHCEEFEEVDEARTEEREQITLASPVHLAHECEEPSELCADTKDQEEEEVESYGEEEEVRTSVSPMDEEETLVQFSEELSERSNSYGNCEVDTIEPRNSIADVYEEYEPTPVSDISEMSSSRPIHVAADIDNQPLESGVEEKSVRTTMYESFEEVLPDAFVSPVIEPSTCYIAAELNNRTTEVEPVEEVVEMAALSSDEEPETIENIAVRGIPESTESTVCITTETAFHHRTEIVQKRTPSIEVEMPLEKEESIEEEPTYKKILPNGHCTSVYISHDIDGKKPEIITETESYETEIPQTLEEEKVAVSELQSDYEIPSNISVHSQRQQEENVEGNVKEEEEVEQLEEEVPVTEDVEETVKEREAQKEEETIEEEEEVEQLEEAVPVSEDVEETVEEREEQKEEETVEEEEEVEQLEEALPVSEDVEETVEEREEQKEEETVEEEEEVEQLEEAVPVTEEVEEMLEEREDQKEEETVEEEEEVEQLEEAVPVTEEVEEMVEEREDQKEEETVEEQEEVEQLKEAVHVTEDKEVMVEEREEQKEEETVEEEEEVEQLEEAVPVTEEVEEMVEEREEQKEEETVEEEEEVEQLEEAVHVTEDVEEMVEEREEQKEEETVEEEEEVEQLEEAVHVTKDVEEMLEEREDQKEEETVEEEEEVEQLEEAVHVTEDVEEMLEEREDQKEEETVEEEEEVEQLEEAVHVTEDVEEMLEEREDQKEEETVEEEEEVEQLEEAVHVTEDKEETVEEREEQKEEETVEEEEDVEQLEEAVPVSEDVEETVEEREEQKEEETVEEEEEVEQLEEAVPVSEDVEETVEEKEELKEEETVEEEEEVEQLEEAVHVTEDKEEMVEEREEQKEEETVEEEEEVEQLEEAVHVTEDVEEMVEEREEQKEEETVEEEEEVEQLEEAVPVIEDVEETVEERNEQKEDETVEEEKEQVTEGKQECELEFPDGPQSEEREQVEEAEKQQVFEIEKSQTLVVDDRFEYISEEELEETEELYETLKESFEEQDNEELIDEENVRVQQTAARIIHIDSQEEENYEAFGEEASEDEIVYDTEVITEVEKEITSALVVKESFSSAVCEDETANENVHPEERKTESPVEETQAKTMLQFSEPVDEDVAEEYVDEREQMDLHYDSDDVFITEEQFEPSKTPDIEECEELESSDEIIDKEVELIQFTEETVEEEKVASGDEEVLQEEKAVSESEERSPTPDEEDERDDLDSSEEFAEENIELIQFDEQVDEDKAIDEGSEVDELYPLSPDVIEEKQIVNESGLELIQFTEQVEEERVKEGERMESPDLEHVESEGQQDDEQITVEKTEHIQFVEHTEEIESAHIGQAEEMLEEYMTKDSGKRDVEEELVISQPIACSTPIFLDEKEQSEDTTSFDDSAEAGYGEEYEDMENIVAHDHSLDVSQPISLEESSDLSNDFYKAEAEVPASKAVAEEFDDSGRLETEPESLEEVEDEKEETSATSSSVVTTTVYEKRIIKTEHTKREFVDFTPLETAEAMQHKESREEHLSPPPKITATEFVAAEEEEGSEEEYLPNFEHPRTYMIESKEVVMDRNAVESKFVGQEKSAPLEELEKEEHGEPAVGIQAPSEMDTGIETEVVETAPQKVETRTTTVSVSHRSEVVRKQQSDIDDLEEKELEERIQRKQKAMEEKLLQDEIKEDIPDKRINESEEIRTEPIFTSISVVKVEHEDDEQRIFREEDATIKMSEDEEKLKEEESSTEEQDVEEDEALTEAAFRAEREEERKAEDTSDEPDRGQKEDEVAQVPIIPLMAASDVAYKTARSEKEIHEDYQEEVEVERIESKTHPVVLTDVDFTEEIEVEKMQKELEEEGDSGKQDVYEEEVEIQRVENQEEQFIEEYHDDVFEEEVLIERIEEEHEEEQESSPDAASLLVYEEELEVAADQIPEQPNPAEVNVVQAEPLHEDAGQNNVGQNNADENDAGENNAGENNEVGQVEEEEQAWEEYEEMEEQDQEIPQEIQGIAVQGDMHLYDNNNNESLPRYYVDFSPGGSFEHESTTSDDGEGPEVYRQGEPMEEDMEEFILVKYEDQSSSSEEDISDHREMYVIHEEDSEDRADEKKEATEESHEEKVAYDQGFVNPALEDIREEEEEEKQKNHQGEGEEVDIEEKLQLEEYERLESFVILEEKLSQVESDESIEDLTSGTDGKRASSEETLNDEDELSETRTSSTLKDGSNSKDDASGDEAGTPETQPSALDTTLTKEIEEETIDLEDGGVLSKRTVREESYSIEEDDGDDDDKDKTLTRKKISKKVITTTSKSETHVKRIESEDNPSPSGSDNESEHQKEHAEDVTTKYTTEAEQPEKQFSGDEKSRKEIDESPEYGTKMIETEQETIDLDDGGVMKKFVTREETYTVEEGNGDGHDDQDSSISRKTVSKKIITTTTTSTSRVTRLEDEPSSFSDDDANRLVETSSEETHTTIIKSRQPEEPLVTAKRQLSLENYGTSSEACKDSSRKRRGFIKRFDSHDSEGHSSEVSSTTDSTGESTSISSEGHVSDEDFSGLDEFQIDCIRQHNIYRHRHRACRLLWSEDLAAAAAQWADHLAATKTLEHSPQKECGENLACAKGYDLRGDKVADMWYEEINDYNFEIPAFNAKCGHFTQMIWRGTKEFGVAKTIADDGSQYVVARYNPPGNILGEFKDSIRRSRGQKTNVRKRRRSSTKRQLSHSSDMSNVLHREKFKNECVISHNYYRSLHGAPPLKWSTMLANEAQTFAEKLTKSGSFMHSGSKEIGECLAFSFGLDLSGRDAVDTWYDEIVDYDYEYPGYTSHTANFTQVVWAGSKEFGIGKAIGDDGSCVVVGKYYPPGNIVGDFQENVKQKGTGF